jgi:hypothetical protein
MNDPKTQAVIRVGQGSSRGRGFVVDHRHGRMIITAAHCLPFMPKPHLARRLHEITYKALLGPLEAKPTVWAQCLFVDPVADIALLGAPDGQELSEPWNDYQQFVEGVSTLTPADTPRRRLDRISVAAAPPEPFPVELLSPPEPFPVELLYLNGKWTTQEALIAHGGHWLILDAPDKPVQSGMSGSPIVSMEGKALAIVSIGQQNPIICDCLPARLFRHH